MVSTYNSRSRKRARIDSLSCSPCALCTSNEMKCPASTVNQRESNTRTTQKIRLNLSPSLPSPFSFRFPNVRYGNNNKESARCEWLEWTTASARMHCFGNVWFVPLRSTITAGYGKSAVWKLICRLNTPPHQPVALLLIHVRQFGKQKITKFIIPSACHFMEFILQQTSVAEQKTKITIFHTPNPLARWPNKINFSKNFMFIESHQKPKFRIRWRCDASEKLSSFCRAFDF